MVQPFRSLKFLLIIVALSFLPVSVGAQTRRPARFRQQTPSAAFECRVFCSEEKLRTPVAELTWRSTEARLSTSRIEVTVYKDGFQTGKYVALRSTKGERSYQLPQVKQAQTQELIPALRELVVVEASSLRARPGVVAVRIEGLEPGLNYFWRVVSTTSGRQIAEGTTRCQAPVCPADMQPNDIP